MKGKFVKGEIISLAIAKFKLEISRLSKLNDSGIDAEEIDSNIKFMWEYRHAVEYLEGSHEKGID